MDSNHRPPAYKTGTLTAELQAHGWDTGIRTPTDRIKICSATVTLCPNLVDRAGLEPAQPEASDLQSGELTIVQPVPIWSRWLELNQRFLRPKRSGLTRLSYTERLFALCFLALISLLLFVLFFFLSKFLVYYFSNIKSSALITILSNFFAVF